MTEGVELRFMDSKACLSVLTSRLVSYCLLFFGSTKPSAEAIALRKSSFMSVFFYICVHRGQRRLVKCNYRI